MKSGWIQSYDSMGYVPFFKRFFLGGTKTIRGFNEDQILPVDDEEWPAWEKDPLRPELLGSTKTSLGGRCFG